MELTLKNEQKPSDIKMLATALIGNTLEYYDYMLYAAYATVISQLFLPGFKSVTVVYIGLLVRPLGALIFGHIGDKWSRRYALSLTMYLMAIPSLILCLLPPYEKIGALSIGLIVMARMLQAFCAAGEYNGSAIMSIEMRPKGYVNGLITASCALGCLISYAVSFMLGKQHWRYGFFIGLLIALIGYRLRKKGLNTSSIKRDFVPLSHIFKTHKKSMFLTAVLGGKTGASAMLFYVSIPQMIGTNYKVMIGISLLALAYLGFGYVSDFVKNKTLFFILSAFLSLFLTFPMMSLIKQGWHVTGMLVLALICGLHTGTQHIYYVNLFPKNMRYRAISFSFVTGSAFFASIVPMFLGLFYKDSDIIAVIVVSFVVLAVFTTEIMVKFLKASKTPCFSSLNLS